MKGLIRKILKENDFEWAQDIMNQNHIPRSIKIGDGKRFNIPSYEGHFSEGWHKFNGWNRWLDVVRVDNMYGEVCFVIHDGLYGDIYIPMTDFSPDEIRFNNLNESKEDEFEWVKDIPELPFEVSKTPSTREAPKNIFKIKTLWDDSDRYIRETYRFNAEKPHHFEWFINVCKFYKVLLNHEGGKYNTWRRVSEAAKSVGLGLGSFDQEDLYGTPKDMSDYVFGFDYPAELDSVEIYYYDKDGIEYEVNLR